MINVFIFFVCLFIINTRKILYFEKQSYKKIVLNKLQLEKLTYLVVTISNINYMKPKKKKRCGQDIYSHGRSGTRS